MEKAAVVITGLFTLGLIVRFALTHHLFLLWAGGFMAIAMSREIHFTGAKIFTVSLDVFGDIFKALTNEILHILSFPCKPEKLSGPIARPGNRFP